VDRKVTKFVERSKSLDDRFDHRHNARSDWRRQRAQGEPSRVARLHVASSPRSIDRKEELLDSTEGMVNQLRGQLSRAKSQSETALSWRRLALFLDGPRIGA
jgi:hypothetical protein